MTCEDKLNKVVSALKDHQRGMTRNQHLRRKRLGDKLLDNHYFDDDRVVVYEYWTPLEIELVKSVCVTLGLPFRLG